MQKYEINSKDASNLNNFEKSSLLEREKMKELFDKYNITNYDFTEIEGYDKHDGIFTHRKEVIFETKIRRFKSSKYETTYIEYEKIKYLLKEAKKQQRTPFLFIFFEDDCVLPIELDPQLFYQPYLKQMPATTEGHNEKVWKLIVEFKVNKEKLINI